MEYGKKEKIGGFELLKHKVGDMTFVKVGTIMGNWAINYREDCMLYAILDSERNEENNEALHVLFVNAFMASNFIEAEFQHEVLSASDGLQERINKVAEPVSDEEDAEILENLRTEHEMVEALVKDEGWTQAPTGEIKTAADKQA